MGNGVNVHPQVRKMLSTSFPDHHSAMPESKNDSKAQANWIAAIGEQTRLALLRALATDARSVTQLAKECDMELVNVSHHLGILRDVGLVTFEKDGRFAIYSLAGATATATILELAHESGIKVLIPLG